MSGDRGGRRLRRLPRIGATGARFPRLRDDDAVADEAVAAGADAVADEAAEPAGADEVAGDAAEPAGAPDDGPAVPGVPASGAPPSPDGDGPDGTAPPSSAPDPLVGRTGARFNSRARKDRRAPRTMLEPASRPPEPEVPTPRDEFVGRTGARFGSWTRRARREAARAAAEDAVVPAQAPPRHHSGDPDPDDAPTLPLYVSAPSPASTRTAVRPYYRTGGRTRTSTPLALETLVSLPSPRPPLEDPEHRAIGDLCGDPRSVAEVAALLAVPLGVARVLLDDMAVAGLLVVHPTAVSLSPGPGPDLALLDRVLSGLHRL